MIVEFCGSVDVCLEDEEQEIIDIWKNGFLSHFYIELFLRVELSSLNRIYNLVMRKRVKENHEIVFYLQANKVDSALMLLDVYRDKIHYDVKKKEWIVVR